jgi:transposase
MLIEPFTINTLRRVRDLPFSLYRIYLEFAVRRVHCRKCGAVKREILDWLAQNLS